MKLSPAAILLALLVAASGAAPQAIRIPGTTEIMRVKFERFEQSPNPKTGVQEYVFTLFFWFDRPPVAQIRTLRRGDQFEGYTIGEFVNRVPVILPTDGIKPGTEPTLELIHTKSGKKHILEIARGYAVPRDH